MKGFIIASSDCLQLTKNVGNACRGKSRVRIIKLVLVMGCSRDSDASQAYFDKLGRNRPVVGAGVGRCC